MKNVNGKGGIIHRPPRGLPFKEGREGGSGQKGVSWCEVRSSSGHVDKKVWA